MDSFQERKHKNFQVESDPFFWSPLKLGFKKKTVFAIECRHEVLNLNCNNYCLSHGKALFKLFEEL